MFCNPFLELDSAFMLHQCVVYKLLLLLVSFQSVMGVFFSCVYQEDWVKTGFLHRI